MNSTPPDRRRFWRGLLPTLIALCCATPAHAGHEQELAALRARIEKLQTELDETRGERDTARDDLRESERRIGKLLGNLRRTETQAKSELARVDALEKSRANLKMELRTLGAELARVMRAMQVAGHEEPVKLLLSQDDPARVSRMLVYYRYLGQARAARANDIKVSLAELDSLEQQLGQRRRALLDLHTNQLREKQELETARAERRTTLARLNTEVRNQAREIERARHNAERLSRLVQELSKTLAESPALAEKQAGPVGRGRWPIPIQGRLVARFGSPRPDADLHWRGIFLAAAEGQPVRAPTHARVVYADWLRGFGLLMILDHGGGLMTLYGHNQSLYKGVGDAVEAGETVALSGSTGGPPQPGLYFEVRERGEPRDPLRWCKL